METKIPVTKGGRVITRYGFDTTPHEDLEIAVSSDSGNWEGPRGVIKFFAWQKGFIKNLHTLRTMYNGVSNLLDPAAMWTAGDMASLSWALYELGQKLGKMAEKVNKLHTGLGGYHGYRICEEGQIYPSLTEALEAKTQEVLATLDSPQA